MRTTLKVSAIINIVVGGLCMLGSDYDWTLFAGGMYWVAIGIITLVYLNNEKK